jgi:two-component system C4-dicarboxylate transport sensor histidine kinase DctB
MKPRRILALIFLCASAALLALGGWGYERARQAALAEAASRSENTLRLAVAALGGQLRRFDRLPALIARSDPVRAVLQAPADTQRVALANAYLQGIAEQLQASDVYVMALDGTTLAASNHATQISFVGGNFAFRPYFQNALTAEIGRFYALGTTSLVRGYYFGAPVRVNQDIIGVLVFKIDLDSIEDSWRGSDYEVIVTDPEGIVFMSSHPAWTFGATQTLTEDRLARTQATRRYANAAIRDLQVAPSRGPGGRLLWGVDGRSYLVLSEHMPDAEWTVHVLTDTAPVWTTARTRVAVAALLAGLAGLGGVILLQRRARLAERLSLQAGAQAQLEQRVQERTQELAEVNRQLQSEVAERGATEDRLRATQAELVQAGKLAALGQMSAALSHEFNQPLGAARNFAENAQLLIERGRVDEAHENVGRILSLIDRMVRISRNLRNFARMPNERLADVALPEVVQAAQEIIAWRLGEGVRLIIDPVPDLHVTAGSVRLQQVLVNILSNAIDAVEGQAQPLIRVSARDEGGIARIMIQDNGPGIAPANVERIFDPFFSTKGVGKGLGLGLSISYNIVHDFGGTLTAANHPDGGAVFTLSLPLTVAEAAQ